MELQNYSSFSPSEAEFLAENELVTIVPNMKIDALHFIMGTYGPFLADSPGIVPLWLACMLKESQQARIICPPWMQKIALEEALKEELRHPEKFSPLPYHYVEIAELLLRYARDDIEQPDKIELLLEELQTLREGKIQSGGRLILTEAQGQDIVESVNITNLGAMEANMLREGIVKVMDVLAEFNRAQTARAGRLSSKSSSSSSSSSPYSGKAEPSYYDDGNAGAGKTGGIREAMRKKLKRSLKSRVGTRTTTTTTEDNNEDTNENNDETTEAANTVDYPQAEDNVSLSNRTAHQAGSISQVDNNDPDGENSASLERILTSTTTTLSSSSSSFDTSTENNDDTGISSRGLRRFRKGGNEEEEEDG